MIKRREFIAGLGSAAAWPVAASAQQAALPVIGVLSPDRSGSYVAPEFRQGLSQAGYAEGRNVAIEYHWADGQYDRMPALAADLVRRQVSVIYTTGLSAVVAAKAATSTIPILFLIGANPVDLGLVASLNRPGGNVTGATILTGDLAAKRLQLLHEAVPTAKVIAALRNPNLPNQGIEARTEAAGRALGLQVIILHASTEREIDTVITTLRDRRAGALFIFADPFFASQDARFAALLLQDGVPAISPRRDFALAGGLMSYGSSIGYLRRQLGIYTGRILKGEKPADLPVEQATKLELIINLKTAKALGLTIPETLLATADEVIE
jgi:putative tryptophan/tyrosine transport system substrate-binding protein